MTYGYPQTGVDPANAAFNLTDSIIPEYVLGILNGTLGPVVQDVTWVPVEHFASSSDTAGDDTAMFNRATDASVAYGYGISLKKKTYNVTGWVWQTRMRFRGAGSNGNFGSIITPLTGDGVSTPDPVITLDSGPCTDVFVESICIKANTSANNDDQIAIQLTAAADGTSTGGLWWSRIKDLHIYNFKLGLWLRGGVTGGALPHQFNLWERLRVFRRASAESTCVLVTGQASQQVFSGACQFDAIGSSNRDGTNFAARYEFSTDAANQGYWDGTTPTLAGGNAPGYNYIEPGCTSQNSNTVFLGYGASSWIIGLWAENAYKSFDFKNSGRANVLAGARCANAASDGSSTGYAIGVDSGCTLTINSLQVTGSVDWFIWAGSSEQGIYGIENIQYAADAKSKWKNVVRQKAPSSGTLTIDGNKQVALVAVNTPVTAIVSWVGIGVPILLRAYPNGGDIDVPFASGGDITLPLNRSTGAEVPLLVLHKGDEMMIVRDDFPSTDKWKIVSLNRVHQVAAAQPTTGWYAAGEFVYNNSPVPSAGKVLLGWARITDEDYASSTLHHTAGTNWTPCYVTTT